MTPLPYAMDRTVVIHAAPETVFRFFTDSARWAKWWGAGSTIDPQLGGKVYIRYPGAVEVQGEVLAVSPPERIVFSYGYATGKPIPAGASRVTIRLEPVPDGTRLHLLHEFAETAPRDEHIQGWRFQLSLFSNVVANEAFANAASVVDQWFAAWIERDGQVREENLAQFVTPAIRFRDRFSLLDSIGDLSAHIGASQRFMPGMSLERKGDVRHCQGTVLADWVARSSQDGQAKMSGTSVFVFSPDLKIESVTSVANIA
ncbi:MAG TPA: SRPBCC domain-containing protein [Bryobacteraceae bacterium]|nr:SRPBCC domain-containing protein [Bryobacteraceae bacterium]